MLLFTVEILAATNKHVLNTLHWYSILTYHKIYIIIIYIVYRVVCTVYRTVSTRILILKKHFFSKTFHFHFHVFCSLLLLRTYGNILVLRIILYIIYFNILYFPNFGGGGICSMHRRRCGHSSIKRYVDMRGGRCLAHGLLLFAGFDPSSPVIHEVDAAQRM